MIALRGNIRALVPIDDGKSYDTDILDVLIPEPGAVYIMDRGFLDFARLHRLTSAAAFFIVRAKRKLRLCRLASQPTDRSTGLICDQIVRPGFPASAATHTVVWNQAQDLTDSPQNLRMNQYRILRAPGIQIHHIDEF